VFIIDLAVVLFGHLSTRHYLNKIDAAEARERAGQPQPRLYEDSWIQKREAADAYECKIDLVMVVFTTLGIFVAGSQSKASLIRAILLRTAYGLIVIESLLLLTTVVLFVEFDAWRGGEFLNVWHGWLLGMVNASWFAFVLIRITAVFLAALLVGWLWRRSRTIGATIGIGLLLAITTFCIMTSYLPAGIYGVVDEIERWPDEDHYYRFANGKFESVSKDGAVQMGHYEKTADGWILSWADTRYKLKSSWFGIWMINAEFPENRSFLGRRILPFLRPASCPYWLQ
jgi:hypothetical protein